MTESRLTGPVRIAVDIGGTFTDLEILEERSGRHWAHKVPTTPDDPSRGLMVGVRGAAERFGFELAQVSSLMHGTTIATNAVLEDKLPPAALVTTAGFTDVLEIGRHVRTRIYDAVAEPRRLLVPRRRRFGVEERVSARGVAVRPLDRAQARTVAEQVAASGAESVAVCFLHAYANPQHELAMAEVLAEALGHDRISLSHAVSPELREYERTSTTVLNALLIPVVRGYLDRLAARMRDEGFAPTLFLVQSNGGVTSPRTAAEQPARLLLSGPSGGALAARTLGARLGEPNLVGIDMGGTSLDVCLVQDGRTRLVTQSTVDGCPVRLPMIEIRTIGAGGGSIARADATGRLTVGPESAGAMPGPAAYGHGGGEATVTDANVALGRIDPSYFLGGAVHLDAHAAQAVVERRVAGPLGLEPAAAAAGIVQVAVARMASAIRLSLYEKGLDPRDFALVPFGGAGGLHAAEIARELGMRRVIYPREAGTLSAWGMLFSDVVHDLARSRPMPATADAVPVLLELARELHAEGEAALARDAVPAAARHHALALDLRYPGQAYEITVPLAGIEPSAAILADAVARFHRDHETQYAHSEPEVVPELVTLRLTATGALPKPLAPQPLTAGVTEPKGRRRVWVDGGWHEIPVLERDCLRPGLDVAGPLVVEEPFATHVVPGGWRLGCAASGELVATREGPR